MALTVGFSYTLGASAVIANALTGLGIQIIGKASLIDLWMTADTNGDTFGMNYTVGGDSRILVPAGAPINVAAAAGVGPLNNQDQVVYAAPIPANAQLVLNIAGANTHVGRGRAVVSP